MKKELMGIVMSLAVCATAAGIVSAAGEVAVNEENFPDKGFREYVLENIDDGDGTLTSDEMDSVMDINLSGAGIQDLTGLSQFGNLQILNISSNEVGSIDLTPFKDLENLICSGNILTAIDVTSNPKLTVLELSSNNITSLDVSGNPELVFLGFSDNKISSIDLGNNTKLKTLIVNSNPIGSLNLKENKALVDLQCSGTGLAELDLSSNKSLMALNISDNSFTSIDVSMLTDLQRFDCSSNKIGSLDLSENTKLSELTCSSNCLTSLDLKNNKELKELRCKDNKIEELDIRTIKGLEEVYEKGKATDAGDFIFYGNDDNSDALSYDKTVNLIVTNPKITLDKDFLEIVCGEEATLIPDLKNVSGNITWKSSDKKVAKVDSTGKITSKMAGTVTITASTDGSVARCVVTVLYKDVTNHEDFWFTPTNSLTAAGVVKGYNKQTKFKPAAKCTRAQMVTFIWRLMGEPAPKSKTCKFTDVQESDYFYKACIWGNEKHIVEGYRNGKFGPQIVCARRHAVTFLWRLAGKPDPSSSSNKFKDVNKKDYYYYATLWASEQKILEGYEDGTFRPNGACLRRQMVTFLYKYDKFVNGKG